MVSGLDQEDNECRYKLDITGDTDCFLTLGFVMTLFLGKMTENVKTTDTVA